MSFHRYLARLRQSLTHTRRRHTTSSYTSARYDKPVLESLETRLVLSPNALNGISATAETLSVSLSLPFVGDIISSPEIGFGWVYVDPSAKYRSLTGVVQESFVSPSDFPSEHESHDFNAAILADPGQENMLSIVNAPGKLDLEWETGDYPTQRGSDATDHIFPKWAWPSPGDRVWVNGSFIYDAGHPQSVDGINRYRSEIHPARAIATMRDQWQTLPGTGTTPVEVTATDLFIHGDGGYATNVLNEGQDVVLNGRSGPNETNPITDDFEFDIPLPARPSPSAILSYSVDDGPGNTIDIAPIITPMPDQGKIHVKIPLAGSGVSDLDTYARHINVGWVVPSPALHHIRLTLTKMVLNDTMDTLGDGEDSFFYLNIDKSSTSSTSAPNEWIRLVNYQTGGADMNDFGGGDEANFSAPFDFYVANGKPVAINAHGYDQDGFDDVFGNHSALIDQAGAYASALFSGADNDEYNDLTYNVTAPTYNTGQLVLSNPDDQFELFFNIDDIPLTNENSADLKVTQFSNLDNGVPIAGDPLQYKVTVENLGPALAGDVTVHDSLITNSPDYTVDSASYVIVTADNNVSSPTAISFDQSGFVLQLGTLPIGARAIITMNVTPVKGGTFDNYVSLTTSNLSVDPNLGNNSSDDQLKIIPKPPGAPDLQPGSDTGGSSTDNYTSTSNPTFIINPAENDATVQLLRDGVIVATRVGAGLITDPGPGSDGTYLYSARQVDTVGDLSVETAALQVTIDATAPATSSVPVL